MLELALALALLADTALMTRSLLALYRADAVVDTSNVALMGLTLPGEQCPTAAQRLAFFHQLKEHLGAIAPVESATWATVSPFYTSPIWSVAFDGRATIAGGAGADASYVVIGPRYFETLRVPLRSGRAVTDDDGAPGRESAIVSQRFASMYCPGRDPVSERIRVRNPNTPNAAAPGPPPRRWRPCCAKRCGPSTPICRSAPS